MKKLTVLFSIVALMAAMVLPSCANSVNTELPKREFRGAWLHVVGNTRIRTMSMEQVKKMFTNTLDTLQKTGCNAVVFQIRPTADAFYHSDIEQWSRYLTGENGLAPEPFWDPLQFMIEESHKRGMELHAWCNPYRVTSLATDTLCSEHLYYKNPEIFVKHGKQIYFNPGEPASIEHTVKVIADVVSRYDLDAIHFDDYFYPYPIKGEEFDDEAAFQKYGPAQGFTTPEQKGDWRRNNVTTLIKELNDTIKAIKPWVRFGISPFGIHRNKKDTPDGSGSETNGLSNYEELFADVPLWVEKGYIDYNVPQLYWKIGHKVADYDILIHWWNDTKTKAHLYIGQNIGSMREKDLTDTTTTQLARKMELVRTLPNVDGNVWWPGWSITRNSCNIADSLVAKYQKYPALVPAYTWLDSKAPAALENVVVDNRYVIKWNQNEKDAADPMQKSLFYVVYSFPEGVEANAANMADPQYIVKITNENSFNVMLENPNHKPTDKYVVTALDRCWNESKPSAVVTVNHEKKYHAHYYKRFEEFENDRPITENDIVFLGNSLTEGGHWSEYYPETEAELNKKGGAIRNRGIIGDTADGISDRLDQILPGQPYKLFLLTGANDVSHHLSVDSIVTLIDNLVGKIQKESPKTQVYLQSMLPFNESFKRYKNLNGKTHMVAKINAGLANVAEKRGVPFIHLFPLFLEKGTENLEPSITRDGLHLTQDGYKIWKEAIREYVK